MKLNIAALLSLLIASVDAGGNFFHAQSIPYEALMTCDPSMRSSFENALTTSGIISIQGIPGMKHKDDAMVSLPGCAIMSKAAKEHTFPDGTRRLTLATHSVPGGVQTMDHKTSAEACESFNQASKPFRLTVASVTQAFADCMAASFDLEGDEPLLTTEDHYPFHTIANVVENGEHLEHFHSYLKLEESEEETIEMHTDQGLFLAFTPGRIIKNQKDSTSELTSGFFVQQQGGIIAEVEFGEEDDLVFLLGDGVNQYINDRLSKKLYAVPHALRMAPQSESRVWYGRMVLPPADALHPAHGKLTFGDLRQSMIDAAINQREDKLGLGCSGSMIPRDLSATTCEGNTIYCWHRCMNATEYGVSSEICANQDLELSCINPRLQIWAGVNHGDFYPACADPAVQEIETEIPALDEYPRPEDKCTDEYFNAFASDTGYNHSFDLEGNATFMWNIEDGAVNGRLVYDGLFGWIAFGFANVGGEKNGMHGVSFFGKQSAANVLSQAEIQ